MKILVTGGAGYIGSTVCSALEDKGHSPVVIDSLINGNKAFVRDRIFYHGDIGDRETISRILSDHADIVAVVHCAALAVVPESVEKPYDYYKENVTKSIEMFWALCEAGIERIVFSSTASLYQGNQGEMVTETSPIKPISPYARTKHTVEMLLSDFCDAYTLRGIALRYFNPIGADPYMRSGPYTENPTHILGKLIAVADGLEPMFLITGTSWPTRDGTGIRDYLHVWDLAQAHIAALERFDQIVTAENPFVPINLGTGHGVTVREFVDSFQRAYGGKLAVREAPARPGDTAGSFASCDRAWDLLEWKTRLSLEQSLVGAIEWSRRDM